LGQNRDPRVPTLFSRWLYTTIGAVICVDSLTKVNSCGDSNLL